MDKFVWTVSLHSSSFASELKPVNAYAAARYSRCTQGKELFFLCFVKKFITHRDIVQKVFSHLIKFIPSVKML
jgi:hypothetical protein